MEFPHVLLVSSVADAGILPGPKYSFSIYLLVKKILKGQLQLTNRKIVKINRKYIYIFLIFQMLESRGPCLTPRDRPFSWGLLLRNWTIPNVAKKESLLPNMERVLLIASYQSETQVLT